MFSMSFGIVVDSAQDIPVPLAKKYGIRIVPTIVRVKGEEYLDGETITSDSLSSFLFEGYLAQTSQPSPGAYFEAFESFNSEVDEILTVSISSRLSGIYQTALIAAREFMEFENVNITVFDSYSVSLGAGSMALIAAELRNKGYSLSKIIPVLDRVKHSLKILILIDSLEYLHRGGRIGRAKMWLGKLMNAKPIVEVKDGLIDFFGKTKGWEKGIHRLAHEVQTHIREYKSPFLLSAHFGAEIGIQLLESLLTPLEIQPYYSFKIGPTLLSHVGPKVIAVGFAEYPKELKGINIFQYS